MVTLYNVVSADWFITDKDGEEDFIPDTLWPTTLEVMRGYDAIVLSRGAYEALREYPPELLSAFESLPIPKMVVSQLPEYQVAPGYELVLNPEEVLPSEKSILICSGEIFNNYLLSKGWVNAVLLHQLPVSLGEGKPVFDAKYRELLVLNSEKELREARQLRFSVRHT